MALMLIDTREPPPDRRPRSSGEWLRVVPFVVGLVCVVSAGTVQGLGGLVLALAGLFIFWRAVARAFGDFSGLREHRQ